MPRYKRWSPISHEFNRDPEIIELRRRFGDWTALAWQEVLHEADRNDGIVMGTLDQIAFRLGSISLKQYQGRAAKTARLVLDYALNCGWIALETSQKRGRNESETIKKREGNESETDCIRVSNHWKYHRMRDPKTDGIGAPPNQNQNQTNKEEEEKLNKEKKKTPDKQIKIVKKTGAWAVSLKDLLAEMDRKALKK